METHVRESATIQRIVLETDDGQGSQDGEMAPLVLSHRVLEAGKRSTNVSAPTLHMGRRRKKRSGGVGTTASGIFFQFLPTKMKIP